MENDEEKAKGKISPERAMKILHSEGLYVSIEEAKAILDFLKKLANITVANYLRRKKRK